MFKNAVDSNSVTLSRLSNINVSSRKEAKARRPKPKDSTKPNELLIEGVADRWLRYCARCNQKRLRRFLLEVYSAGTSLKKEKERRRAARKFASLGKLRPRKSLDIFTAIIAAGSIDNPVAGKQRRRWSRALRYIESKDVDAEDFQPFLTRIGGICKAANRFAAARRE